MVLPLARIFAGRADFVARHTQNPQNPRILLLLLRSHFGSRPFWLKPCWLKTILGSRLDWAHVHVGLNQLRCHVFLDVPSRMLDIGRGSREGAISVEASIKSCGRTKQWNAALWLLREGIRSGAQAVPSQYVATISACGKGRQWQHALSVLSEMWEAMLEPSVIFSYSVGISACEKGEQWQRALALLSETWETKLEPDSATTLGSALARKVSSGSRLWSAVAAGSGAAQQDGRDESGAHCHQLQCRDQRVRERSAVAAGFGAAQPDGRDETGAQLSYNAGISACGKGEQWQRALAGRWRC
ncbi:unnamed protein product [Prorocentrum cordatum]|uniref:Pentatricopeptide repeat-containing protein, chloroplastic n=1 Tax=Prorocentrum cordatum TaxID=2364126 RepID=A0ABN9SH00_9DINO|nr:unnamed protein product [Polarella glacialis]